MGRGLLGVIRRWWQGEFRARRNSPDAPVTVIGGRHHQHWTARLLRVLVRFIARDWKWLVGIAISVAGLTIAYLRTGN